MMFMTLVLPGVVQLSSPVLTKHNLPADPFGLIKVRPAGGRAAETRRALLRLSTRPLTARAPRTPRARGSPQAFQGMKPLLDDPEVAAAAAKLKEAFMTPEVYEILGGLQAMSGAM